MPNNANSTKTIAKNTLFLYIRMFFSMGISLFTSRVILEALGVEDYGVYNVVGGIVALFSFLNSTLAGATSRFINYELGKDISKVQRVFSTALSVHVLIALAVLILGETVGYWFLINKLVIPADRLFAAKLLLQFSLITMLFNFTQVPYNASIIAYEKMNIYAYVGLADSILKFLVSYAMLFCNYDRLIIYGFLYMVEHLAVLLFYRSYCTKKFTTCKFKLSLDKEYLKPMLSYSVWDIVGQGSLVIKVQGVNMLLNMFFGAVVNAATGIASQVYGLVSQFSQNVMTAFRPQVVKNYAQKDFNRMEYLINMGATTTFILLLLIGVPLLFEMDIVLKLWLKTVPEYCSSMCKLSIVACLFANFTAYPMMGIDATAKIRDTSIIIGILYLLVIPISYLAFVFNLLNPSVPYLYNALIPIVVIFINASFLHKYVKDFSYINYLLKTVLPGVILFVVDLASIYLLCLLFEDGYLRLFICVLLNSIVTISFGFLICYNKHQKRMIIDYLKNKLKINRC